MRLQGFIYRYGRWISWGIMAISIAGIMYGGADLTTPAQLKIASGREGTYSYEFGKILKKQLEKNTNFEVEVRPTKGSAENRSLLLSGEVDLAILNTGMVSMENLAAVRPLWLEYLHVIMRKNADITDMSKLKKRSVALGSEGSKNREIATSVLKHYALKVEDLDDTDATIARLRKDSTYVGGIVVDSILSPEFQDVIMSGQFDWMNLGAVDGLPYYFPFFFSATLPEGSFPTITTPVPSSSQKTVATTAVLAAKESIPSEVIKKIMPALHRFSMYEASTVLLGKEWTESDRWTALPIHPASSQYYKTYAGLEMLSDTISFLYKFKEIILFSIILMIAVIFEILRRRQNAVEKEFLEETKKLESWLLEIMHIEQEQKKAKDIRLLKQYHYDALMIKEHAIKDMVGKNIQDSNFFQTFLQECVHVIHEIEFKISGFRT
ncbi:MAG: hypothetical protein HQM11_16200 [SAR324 cluster bacterium]|nr:hypothetical protein [SAR324 cluster bacterium]